MFQVFGSCETKFSGLDINAGVQRTFGTHEELASISAGSLAPRPGDGCLGVQLRTPIRVQAVLTTQHGRAAGCMLGDIGIRG